MSPTSILSLLNPRRAAAALALALAVSSPVATAAAPAPSWTEFDAFAAADRAGQPPPGGVVFVGSSSIRLWDDLERAFNAGPVVLKRGFGGSQLSDCIAHLDRLVVQYHPRTVVLYAGDNDLAAGAHAEDVLDRYQRFVAAVHRSLPGTRIVYVSIKPSPARVALMPQIRQANAMIRAWSADDPTLAYVDVFSAMLGDDGEPRPELFRADRLHLSDAGYALWKTLITPYAR